MPGIEFAAVMLPVMLLVIIFTFVLLSRIIKAFSNRGANRQEIETIQNTMREIQKDVADVKAQMADIIITLHDRV